MSPTFTLHVVQPRLKPRWRKRPRGTWAVAMDLPTHIGVVPPVTGSTLVVKVLTETAKTLLGGYFIVEPDMKVAAQKMATALKA